MRLLVVGSIAFDDVETPYGKVERAVGGSCTYFSLAASNFCDVNVVGVVGKDFGEENKDLLRRHDINLEGLKEVEGKTFHWKGKYEDLNEAETLETNLNVFENFDPDLPESYKDIDYVFLGNIDPVLQDKVLSQLKKPKIVALDTMNFWIHGKKKELLNIISKVNWLFINEQEAKDLGGESNIIKACRKITEMGPELIICKRGEYGCMLVGKDFQYAAPSFPIEEVKDPTGAGDSFAGGFMGYITSQNDISQLCLKKATIYATIIASFNIESFSVKSLDSLEKQNIDSRFNKMIDYIRI